MKKLLLIKKLSLFVMLLSGMTMMGQTIVSDGLNGSASALTVNSGVFYSGNSATGDRPASVPFFSEGTGAYGKSNGSATLTTANINTSLYTGVEMSFRLASFSIGSTGNGTEVTDIVKVEVSPDGGTTYYNTIQVTGNSNAQWGFATGTATATTAYDGNTSTVTFNPAGGGNRTADGYSTVKITSLPAVSSLRIRITLTNNDTSERWLLDDFKVTGTIAQQNPSVSTGVTTALSGFGYVTGATTSPSQNFSVSGSNLTADVVVAPTTADYEIATSANGFYTSILSFTPSNGTVTGQTVFVRLKSGLSAGTYNGSIEVKSTGASTKTISLTGSVTNPPASATLSGSLTETTLNTGVVTVTLANDTFAAQLTNSSFLLTGAPTGTTIQSVQRTDNTNANITLSYNAASNDFDSNATLGVTIAAGALVTNNTSALVSSNTLIITAVSETITPSVLSLTGLDYYEGAGPSAAQSFTISATNLYSGTDTITVTAPTNFEVSVTGATEGFATTASITYTGTGTLSSNTVWVRLKANQVVNTYTQNVTVAGGKSSASVSVSGTVAGVPPVNDNCAGAITLGLNASAIPGTFLYATQSIAAIVCGDFVTGSSDEDVWYRFTTTTAGNYTVVADGGDNLDLVLDLRTGACNGTNIACADTENSVEAITASLAANTQYLVRVYDYGPATAAAPYNFTIRVSQELAAPVATDATLKTPTSFVANWDASVNAAEYRLDVGTSSSFGGDAIDVVGWNFPANSADANADNFAPINSGKILTSSQSIEYLSVSGTATNAAQATGWTNGLNSKYWMVEFSTTGFTGLKVSSAQRSSSAGPRDFKLQYRVGTDAWADVPGASITATNFTTGALTNVSLPEACNNQPSVSLRWIMSSNIRVDGGTNIAATANSAIDNILITGNVSAFVPGYSDLPVLATSQLVSGLSPNTTYYYRVRALNSAATSVNSNTITATTGKNNVWNGTAWTAGTSPTGTDAAVIQGNFNTGTNPGLSTVYDLVVNSGTLTIAGGTTVTVTNQVQNTGGTIVAQNNGNLIQVNSVANTGNMTVQRDSSPLFRQDYTMWSSPVGGQNLGAFSPGTLTSRFYTYNEAADAYAAVDAGTNFSAGRGYLIRMPNAAFLPAPNTTTAAGTFTSTAANYQGGTDTMIFNGKFVGTPNNGDVTVTLSETLNGFNLVGNPYPSPINLSSFLNANSDVIDGTVWIWRKTNASSVGSAYVTINASGAYTANGQPEAENPQSVLRQGQGFIVKVKDGNTSANVTFTNSIRTPDTANQFFRNANAVQGQPERHGMRINLSKDGGVVSQLYAGYVAGATLGADAGIDSRYINDNPTVLDMVIGDKEYIIQGRPLPFSAEDVIPLQLKAAMAGSYTVSLNDVEGLFVNSQKIFLKDKLTGAVQNLKDGNYSFTTDAGTFANRFEVLFTAEALDTDNPVAVLNNVVVYQNASGVNITAGNLTIKDVTVYDVRGRVVHASTGINANATVLSGLQPAQQLLIVEVVTDAGKTARKIVY